MAGRARLLAGLAVVISGTLAGTAAYALNDATQGGAPTALPVASAAPTETATPEPTESPTPEPTPTPSPTPSRAASPTPTPSPTASPKPRVTVSSSPTPRHYPYPAPTTTYDRLALSAGMNPQSADAGTVFTLEATATDGDGSIFLTDIDWGDGSHDSGEASPRSCPAYPSPTSNPGPYQPEPDHRSFSRSHVYANAGTYSPTISVRSINADCRPNGPGTETTSVAFTGSKAIHVT
ncbi:MAG: hypothetical protein JWO22_2446 [Frankiales bacterium]|nr:hypothetical protein [Frankiales bacterium]